MLIGLGGIAGLGALALISRSAKADVPTLTDPEIRYFRALDSALSGALARYPNDPGIEQLQQMARDAFVEREDDARAAVARLRSLIATGEPPTLRTFCRAANGTLPGFVAWRDLGALQARYPQGVALIRRVCAATPATESHA